MFELSNFIVKLGTIIANGFNKLSMIQKDQREKQSQYLDSLSETLASAGMAVGDGGDITKQLAELRYHLSEIGSVLRLGERRMSMDDYTVACLCAELDVAVGQTETSLITVPRTMSSEDMSPKVHSQRIELRSTFLQASGIFRGAAVALRGRI